MVLFQCNLVDNKNQQKFEVLSTPSPNMLFVKIKDFNALIDNKPFCDQPVKEKQEIMILLQITY